MAAAVICSTALPLAAPSTRLTRAGCTVFTAQRRPVPLIGQERRRQQAAKAKTGGPTTNRHETAPADIMKHSKREQTALGNMKLEALAHVTLVFASGFFFSKYIFKLAGIWTGTSLKKVKESSTKFALTVSVYGVLGSFLLRIFNDDEGVAKLLTTLVLFSEPAKALTDVLLAASEFSRLSKVPALFWLALTASLMYALFSVFGGQ
ncbi:hypothetical protein WJX72_000031 [[Myrmecia] bisecta]|uniref:Uncharacterized protein n=1 Tax=[Myrmecia] bisecta TaxID=41462 RepID=A0AAW1QDV0_9CHLO